MNIEQPHAQKTGLPIWSTAMLALLDQGFPDGTSRYSLPLKLCSKGLPIAVISESDCYAHRY